MSTYRRCAAAFVCTLPFSFIAQPNAVAAEQLQRVFTGEPNQLTLPPDFPTETKRPDSDDPAAQDCNARDEQNARGQPEGLCSSEASDARSPSFDDEVAPNAKEAELRAPGSRSGRDSAKSQP